MITIPGSVENIAVHAFDKFLNVEFEVKGDNRHYGTAAGTLMNKAGDTAHSLVIDPDGTALYPEGTIAFDEDLLSPLDSLHDSSLIDGKRNIYLPASMTKFPDQISGFRNRDQHAFYHCPSGSEAEKFAIRLGLSYTNEMGRPIGNTEVRTPKGTLYFDLYEDHAVLTGYSGEDEVVEVPSQAEGKEVTAVGNGREAIYTSYSILEDTGREAPNLTKLVIPEGVTTIAAEALSDVSYQTEVVLPTTITHLGREAIGSSAQISGTMENLEILEARSMGNLNGEPFVLGPGVRYIDPEAFAGGVSSFEQIGENENYSVRDGVLFNADGTELIKYPIYRIDEAYVIPEGTERIGKYAFSQSGSLVNVRFPKSLKVIEDYAFSYCSQLSEIVFDPETELEEIRSRAFSSCGSLTEITLPAVKEIGNSAFSDCKALSTVHLAEGTRTIGNQAFSYTQVSAPEFPESLVRIGRDAYQDGMGGVLREGSAQTIRIPAKVIEVGDNAFGSIGNTAFEVDPQNPAFSTVDGMLMDRDQNTVIACPSGRKGRVVIPDGTTCIEDNAFYSALMITDVEIPDSVMHIGTVNFEPIREENANGEVTLKYNVTHCSKGSYAENFARNRGIPYEAK